MAPKGPWDVGPDVDPYTPTEVWGKYGDDAPNGWINDHLLPNVQKYAKDGRCGTRSKHAPLEHVLRFLEGYGKFHPVSMDVARDHCTNWGKCSNELTTALSGLKSFVDAHAVGDQLSGATAGAIMEMFKAAQPGIDVLQQGTGLQGDLVDMFSRNVSEHHTWFEDQHAKYQDSIDICKRINQDPTEIIQAYDQQARDIVHGRYNPVINLINSSHPDISAVAAPQPSGLGSPPTTGGGGRPSGPGGGGGVPQLPSMPAVTGPNDPTATQPTAAPPDATKGIGDAAKPAGNAAQQAAAAPQNAAQQGAGAAKPALDQGLNGAPKGTGRLPEGVLGLGPKGVGGAAKTGGAGGGRPAGGGAPRPVAKPAAQMAPASKTVAASAPSRAGVSNAGAPGSGAPAAGNRGAAAGQVHKTNKALRHTRNGLELVGETDAVIPVVGDEPQESAPAKST